MATTTPNNAWPVPTSTDYVKDGATAIETLGDAIDTSVGQGLLAWQTWSPVLSGGWLNGNGTWTARYARLGNLVFFNGLFVLGTTTTKGTNMICTLPVTCQNTNVLYNIDGLLIAGGTSFQLTAAGNTGVSMTLFPINTAGTYASRSTITTTVPGTWVTGDSVRFSGYYEAN
jgi:hypothetical protein